MTKNFAAAAVLTMLACTTAQAASPTIKAGQYSGTLQFTNVQDPFGFCQGLVATGQVQVNEGTFKLGTAPVVVTPVPGTSSTGYGVGAQICTFPTLPTSLSASGTTTTNGTTTCSVPNPTYPTAEIVTNGSDLGGGTSNSTINTVVGTTFKITTQNAALEVQAGGPGSAYQPICFISTDQLFVRSGT